MMMQSIGDLARGFVLERQTTRLKSDIGRMTQALGSGRVVDAARHLGGNTAPLAAIDAAIARAEAHKGALADLGRRAGTMQTVLAALDRATAPVRATAVALGPDPSPGQIALAATEALGRFEDAVALVNTRDASRSIFAGAATDSDALAAPAVILGQLRAAIGPIDSMPGDAVAEAVRTWFAAPTGFAAAAWLGDTTMAGPVAAQRGQAIAVDTTALDPAIRKTFEGLALAVLAGEATAAGATLLGEAAASLTAAADGRALLAGRIGLTEARIADAAAQHGAEASALAIRRNSLTEADPFATASALTNLQDRLETVYAVTARLSRLTLADFLR